MPEKVFFFPVTREEGPVRIAAGMEALLLKLDILKKIERKSFVAVKTHFGEKDNTGYIKSQWLEGIIRRLKERSSRVFFTDTNTLYTGDRSNAVEHLTLARSHGFDLDFLGIPVIMADGLIGRDDEEILVNYPRVKNAKIASAFMNSDVLICLSHFTGHVISGFGAALKNLGMGCASRAGKLEQHSDLHPRINPKLCRNCGTCLDYCPTAAVEQGKDTVIIRDDKCIGCGECLVVCRYGAVKTRWDGDAARVQEKIAEYAAAVHGLFGKNAGYINVLLQISKDCDCMSKNGSLIAPDIGLLSSADPVALDKASMDLVIAESGRDVIKSATKVDWGIHIRHAVSLGMGGMDYVLETVSV